ncbi:LOW QUALITY PROTEIN: E3 ubiquitin-protein ligase SINA-like 7 [Argentina anserina]|uniref:LOW QUALITY PROTEIN: E3 ubiquitin-protein ligase SINA-like 7 n=1 Tax=Argentina anserina TaxID=57926 RepID=UPI0021765CC5|nr:LOW QUALITY PROTEIN: E3 ubiquitin-protein ligase SINA-like 7 [Potentilla anserina]
MTNGENSGNGNGPLVPTVDAAPVVPVSVSHGEKPEKFNEEGEVGHEGPNNEPANAGDREGHRSNIVVTLPEPSLLDCPICYEPLTIPVFQCDENGHYICCSSCCTKINNKCPSCSSHIRSNRCRAVQKFVEASITPCQNIKYGCKNTSVTCNKKTDHETPCVCMPCSCPNFGCEFVSSAKELYKHFSNDQVAPKEFLWDEDFLSFSITLSKREIFIVLRDKNDGKLFVLYNDRAAFGNLVTLNCSGIQPNFMEGFNYYLEVKHRETILKLRSVTKKLQDGKIITLII